MLPQDPQKKISGITNRPRPIGTQDLNRSTGEQPSSGDFLGPKPNPAAQVNTAPQGTPPDTGETTPPQEKQGFLAAMKQKLTNSGKEYLVKKVTGEDAPKTEGPRRQVDTQGSPTPNLGQSPPKHERPTPEVPKAKVPKPPKRPQMPKFTANIPKRPKIG